MLHDVLSLEYVKAAYLDDQLEEVHYVGRESNCEENS